MATPINNTASITYGYGRSGTDSAVSNTATTNLIEDFAISAYKLSNNEFFRVGENITYQVHISNDGTLDLYNVTMSDNLGGTGNPLSFVEGSATLSIGGVTSSITPTTLNPLVFTIPSVLVAGENAIITYVARVSSSLPQEVETITNEVIVSANEGSVTGPQILVSPNPTDTISRAEYAEVQLTKNVSASEVSVGDTFSYTLTLSNSGNLEATGVIVTDTLPDGFVIDSITSVTNGVQRVFQPTEYSVDATTNTLTLTTGAAETISVPAAVNGNNGVTVITITGSIQ
ncbi:MAG: DUF11 domain-containing protein [Clostridia bacterium]|nr:DUF11 domain-containing protein [Clostridia bacterium]